MSTIVAKDKFSEGPPAIFMSNNYYNKLYYLRIIIESKLPTHGERFAYDKQSMIIIDELSINLSKKCKIEIILM